MGVFDGGEPTPFSRHQAHALPGEPFVAQPMNSQQFRVVQRSTESGVTQPAEPYQPTLEELDRLWNHAASMGDFETTHYAELQRARIVSAGKSASELLRTFSEDMVLLPTDLETLRAKIDEEDELSIGERAIKAFLDTSGTFMEPMERRLIVCLWKQDVLLAKLAQAPINSEEHKAASLELEALVEEDAETYDLATSWRHEAEVRAGLVE